MQWQAQLRKFGKVWYRFAVMKATSAQAQSGMKMAWSSPTRHVILDRQRVRDNLAVVLPDDTIYDATVLSYDRERDIAALSIEGETFPTIQLGNSDDIHAGQWAMALGHPWGVIDSLTSGIIIGRGNNLPERGDGQDWLALSLKLRPGHSGGPLLDNAGKLIGINTMISGPDIGFAIPVNDVKAFLKETLGGFTAESDEVIAIV